jgi:hypothetical protein
LSGEGNSVDEVLWHFGSISGNYTPLPSDGQGNISQYDLTYEIDDGRPIIAAIVIDDGGTYLHDVLIKGYTGSGGYSAGNVIFNDPGNGGRRRELSYPMFVRTGNSWGWYETLRLVTNPRSPIGTGVGPEHRVLLLEESCTQEITETTQSLQYRAYKYGDPPVEWEWELVFPHSSGYAVVASWTTNSSQDDLTWHVSDFSLPLSYDWKYTYDGYIPGRIQVVCHDPDYHDDAINVLYKPDDLYPGALIYENKTVTGMQPVVRAHEFILLKNDLFLSGADVVFASGEDITIEDGITFDDGSYIDFVIDPNLR